MSTSKKLTAVLSALCLLFLLTACPTPTVPTPPGNTPEQPAGGTPEAPAPVAPTVIGTYTITNMDESESTVIFYSDNTYTEGDAESGFIAAKGTFSGTLAEGETITLTPTEFNFADDDDVDNFMTLEQAQVAFSEGALPDFDDEIEIAFAFMPQPYTIDGTALINNFGDGDLGDDDDDLGGGDLGNDDDDFGSGDLGDDDDDSEDDTNPEEPTAIALFSADIPENQSITFIFYNDETYNQLRSGNTLATGQYAPNDDETELTMIPTTFAFYFYIDPDGPGVELSDEVKYTQFTLEGAIAAALDEDNEITAHLRQNLTEDTIREQLTYTFNSVSFGKLVVGSDENGTTLTVPDSPLVFHEVKD